MYPVEAFIFLIITCSGDTATAVIMGILWAVSAVSGCLIRNISKNLQPSLCRGGVILISILAVNYAIFKIGTAGSNYLEWNNTIFWKVIILGILTAKAFLMCDKNCYFSKKWEDRYGKKNIDYSDFLYRLSLSYGAVVITGIIREILSTGKCFERNIISAVPFLSGAFQSTAVGFFAAGIVLACLHKLNKTNDTGEFWILAACAVLFPPLNISGIAKTASVIISGAVFLLLYLSAKYRMRFSDTPESFKGIPLQLISSGLIYLVLKGISI